MSKNTKKTGILRFFTYFDEKAKEFVGVCLDLSIVKCGENPYYVEKDLVEAAMGYVEAVCKNRLPDALLNQKPPKEYLNLFEQFISATSRHEPAKKHIFSRAKDFSVQLEGFLRLAPQA